MLAGLVAGLEARHGDGEADAAGDVHANNDSDNESREQAGQNSASLAEIESKLEESIPQLLAILVEDIFGESGRQKEAEQFQHKSKMKVRALNFA